MVLPARVGVLILGSTLALACDEDGSAPGGGGAAPLAGGAGASVGGAGGGEISGGGGAPSGGPSEVPGYFRLTASAEATEGDITAVCEIDFIFELEAESSRTDELVQYPGVHGGSAKRTVTAPDGAGFSFSADSFGEVVAELRFADSAIDLAIPINETAEGRFWRELALFAGTLEVDGSGSGSWTCAPLDIDQGGYLDTQVIAQGVWTMEPIE